MYAYILLSAQAVEFRKYLHTRNNSYYLALLCFDGDIVLPCKLISILTGCPHNERSILED